MNEKMRVEVKDYRDDWMGIKEEALTTIKKNKGKYPDPNWKKGMLLAEHSPVRVGMLRIKVFNIPSWVATHLVRHHVGVEKFVSTQRSDRTGVDRNALPQGALVDISFHMNFQAIINISRKRLCTKASPETREVWQAILEAIKEYEPELYEVAARECVYRGFCPELECCGYANSKQYQEELKQYRRKEVESK